jgi:hypothetical protein
MDYKFTRGDSFTLPAQYATVDYSTCPPTITGINITGAAIYFTCKRYKNDPDSAALFQLTVGHGITIAAGTNGFFTVIVPQADTQSLPVDIPYPFDCVIEPVAGGRQTVLSGTLTLKQNTTDS